MKEKALSIDENYLDIFKLGTVILFLSLSSQSHLIFILANQDNKIKNQNINNDRFTEEQPQTGRGQNVVIKSNSRYP